MLAHSGEAADLGNDLLKVSDLPVMMSYDTESGYAGFNPDQQHHYYHQQHHYDQAYHQPQFHGGPTPPQPHQDYYHQQQQHHQQQMMFSQPSQGYSYQPSHLDHYSGYYHQQQVPVNHQQQQQGSYPYPGSQSVMVHNGPSSHGSQNCTPSPRANSDDSGGDCVNEPKLQHLGMPAHFPGPNITPPIPPFGSEIGNGMNGKSGISVSVMNRSLTAARRGKKSKHRDPNEPQKPVSAYALFFRDMQAGIKSRNPNSSFGEVSKHVASMWDALDPDHKAIYKRRTETAKKEYLKRLAAYRASLVSKGGGGDLSASPGPDFGGPRFPSGFETGSPISKDVGLGKEFGSISPPSIQSQILG